MKKRILFLLFLVSLCLIGCGNNIDEYGPDDEGITLIEPKDVIEKYKVGDASHESKAEEATKFIRLHYRRNDDSKNNRAVYDAWNIWAWDMTNNGGGSAYDFTNYDSYGVYVDLELSIISNNKYIDKVGFIVRTDNWSKDPDLDRSIEVDEKSPGGIQEIYVKSGNTAIYKNQSDALKSSISYAIMLRNNKIGVYFKPVKEDTFKLYSKRFGIKINGEEYTNFTMSVYDAESKSTTLILQDDLNISDTVEVSYKFDSLWTNEVPLIISNYFDTEDFINNYSYEKDDLGVTFDNLQNPTKTTFKVWAPTSKSVTLNVYNTGDYKNDNAKVIEEEMIKGQKGVFELTTNTNLDGKYYTYTVTNSKGTNEVVDPYAKSAGLNGKRGMVVNFYKINNDLGWENDVRPNYGNNAVDASIYEIHIRDMTINSNSGVSSENRGKYLGLSESGTTYTESGETVSTGLDHIKELGVSHVQIQPVYDFSSVDESINNNEMSTNNYNWGYDPQNYNVLEGSYSTNPSDGYSRIKEFKKMISSFHNAGINVNMDVVYNHTSSTEDSNFNLLVPYYYYRTYASGTYYNGSGCGNEIASNRFMVNKFIRESCKFYIDEYHISGFRFDLMGLLDNQTMIDVYNDCKDLYSNVLIYGEPWTGGTTKLKEGVDSSKLSNQKTIQFSLAQSYFSDNNVLVGAFNDVIRNAIKGDNSPSRGYVQGLYANGGDILNGIKGIFSSSSEAEKNINPNQVLNYVSCHDNYTLNDQLLKTMTGDIKDAYTQAESIVFLSQGVPFFQEGEDFMRSKQYDDGTYEHNSYNVGDFINNLDYSLKIKNEDIFNKFKELIQFRKDNKDSFCLSSRSEINNKLQNLTYKDGLISYSINDLVILHAVKPQDFVLDGNYKVVYSNVNNDYFTLLTGTYSCTKNESVVLKKAN